MRELFVIVGGVLALGGLAQTCSAVSQGRSDAAAGWGFLACLGAACVVVWA